MVKIAHIGDIHLDSPLTNLKDIKMSSQRRRETADTLFFAINKCVELEVDLVLMAGDVFDSEYINLANCRRIAKKMEQEKNLTFFIAPGNHDYIHPASVYCQVNWPENVHIFSKEKMEKVTLYDKKTCIWGAGFNAPSVERPLLLDFCVEDPTWINIGVLHGEVTNASSIYNPITEEQIGKSKLDYLALGHLHAFSGILQSDKTSYCYAGCLEPRGFDELGQKGFVIAEIEKENSRFYFYPAAKRQYLEVDINVSGMRGEEDICAAISEMIGENTQHLYKIHLTGEVEEADCIDLQRIANHMGPQYYYFKLLNDTQIAREFYEIANERNLTGIFVGEMLQKIKQAQDPEEKEKWECALSMGYQALLGREVIVE